MLYSTVWLLIRQYSQINMKYRKNQEFVQLFLKSPTMRKTSIQIPCSASTNQSINNTTQASIQNMSMMCQFHPDTLLQLYDIDLRQRRCPKCVIYSKDRTIYNTSRFIDIGSSKNIQESYQHEIGNLEAYIKQIQKNYIEKAESMQKTTKKTMLAQLKKQHNALIEQINAYHQKQVNTVLHKIQHSYQKNITQVLKFTAQAQKTVRKAADCEQEILGWISDAILMQDKCKREDEVMKLRVEEFMRELAEIENSYHWAAKLEFVDLHSQYHKIESLSQSGLCFKNIEEQLLIDIHPQTSSISACGLTHISIALVQSPPTPMEPQFSKTQRSSVTNATMQQDRISSAQSEIVSTTALNRTHMPSSKAFLRINGVNELNKIDTHVREVMAKGFAASNMEAKKILQMVSKSFVKQLDLSDNKINSAFVKDLTKGNIGKYLKIVKLTGNPVDKKDPAVAKKIEQLKAQGVTIIL